LAYINQGQPAKAIVPLRKAASDASLAPEAHYLLGIAYFETGDFSKVAAELSGLESSPHAEHVLFLIEESSRLAHRTAEARAAFHLLNTRFPDSAWVHYLMGSAYENQADHQKAIAEYEAALAKDPKLPSANFAIGYLYFQDQAPEDAARFLEKELSVQPCHTLACYYLAELARTSGEMARAERLYRRSLECDDRNVKSHIGLGLVLTGLKRQTEALREFRRAAELDPENATPHYRLAVLYRQLGRTAEADREYERVKQIHAAALSDAGETLKGKP
jgi:tetratricopeptide (TPR) repeat protein